MIKTRTSPNHRAGHSVLVVLLLAVALFAAGRPPLLGQTCPAEQEPNNEPAAAGPLAGCVSGSLDQNDQDLFRFSVSAPAAFHELSLDGVPSALTRAELFRLEDGARPDSLFVLQSPSGETVSAPPLLLQQGEYLLGVSPAGGVGPYTLTMSPAESLPPAGDIEPNDRRDEATPVNGAFSLVDDLEGSLDFFSWTLTAAEADQAWQITAQGALGQNLILALVDTAGSRLAQTQLDATGRTGLFDVVLPAGTYFLEVNGDRDRPNPYLLRAEPQGPPAAGFEREPNDNLNRAVPWDPSSPVGGRLAAVGDDDAFRFTVTEDMAGERFDLRLRSTARTERELCLAPPDAALRHCRTALGVVTLVDLALAPGDYLVLVDGEADPNGRYTLSRHVTGPARPSLEAEPNDDFRQATPLDENRRAAGRHAGDEWDIYRLDVSGPPQHWRLQAVGDGLTRLAYINPAGQFTNQINAANQRRIRMSNLFLLPGTHFIGVRGTGGSYNVMAIPLGPPPPGLEREPNGEAGQANLLRFGEPRIGLLNERNDADLYRFTLPAPEVIRLSVSAPDDGGILTRLFADGSYLIAQHAAGIVPGTPFTVDTPLPPGDYTIRLTTDIVSDSPYTLRLERLDPFSPITDVEPNDRPAVAVPLGPSLTMRGTVLANNDLDWFALPTAAREARFSVTVPEGITINFAGPDARLINERFTWDADTRRWSGAIAAGDGVLVRVTGDGAYTLPFEFSGGLTPQPTPAPLPLSVELRLEETMPAAFWPAGQRLRGTVVLRSTAGQPVSVRLDWHASHYRLRPASTDDPFDVPAGGTAEIPFTLSILPDMPAGVFPLTVRALAANGAAVTGRVALDFAGDHPAVDPARVWAVPESLLGGFNAAALAFGAAVATSEGQVAERQADLHDGYTALADGFTGSLENGPIDLDVDLAGDASLPVTGILLNPQGSATEPETLSDFELHLSADGRTFTPVLSGRLLPTPVEQAFPLPFSQPARFARLRLLDNHIGGERRVALGEWKVVVDPGTPVLAAPNLAEPANGGYLVYAHPQPAVVQDAVSVLLNDGRAATLNLDGGQAVTYVFGFQHDRAARLDRIEWAAAGQAGQTDRLSTVRVAVSLDSPVGPWTELGEFPLVEGTTRIPFPNPVWARYVRLIARGEPANDRFRPLGPETVRIFEQQAGADYRSILAEWGHYNRDAVYEWLTPPAGLPGLGADDNNSKNRAEALASDSSMAGQVQIGRDVDWYRVDVPPDDNAVILELSGSPTVDVRVLFENEAGDRLPATLDVQSADRQVITTTAAAGTTVFFRVEEPPRSVIFSWDSSPSVGPYIDAIYNALGSFVEGVTPGQEVVNFLPFGSEPLLETWGEEPAALQQALNDYPRDDSSSNAETALLDATEALAFRDGTKVVVILTDAETGSYQDTAALWRALEAVRPRVFSLAISSNIRVGEKPANEQDLMQSWAGVNAGFYDFLRTQGETDLAFERATAWLRRPSAYAFTVRTAFVEPPGPGTLQVLSSATGENAVASASLLGDTAVEIIVDASGSMQQPLGDSTRIEVAREVLLDLVENVLPDDIPVALRVFGNREGNFSCRTDLERPLAPLDRAALAGIVNGITPQTNANTAIGAALALVPDDLAAASGPKLVILLTDGEETCDGNPDQVIAGLRARGIDVRVNIVGFAIDDEDLKAEFARWAEAGGGDYFDAAASTELSASLSAALRTPFRVLDAEGVVVAEGLVDGEPVSLAAGIYSVEVLGEPPTVIPEVVVGGEEEVVLRIEAR